MSRQGDFCGTVFALLIATYNNGFSDAPALAAEDIKIRVVDADASLVPARAWVDSSGQRMFTPDDKTATPYARDTSFSFDGEFAMKVPAGRAAVHLVPAFFYWLRGHEKTWNSKWPDSAFLEPLAIDDRHLITCNNMEIERINSEAVPGAAAGLQPERSIAHPTGCCARRTQSRCTCLSMTNRPHSLTMRGIC